MPSYKLTNQADADLVNILNYGIEHFGVEAATEFISGISSLFDEIAQHPLRFSAVDDIKPGYRRAVFNTYSIYFIQRPKYLEISRILRRQDIQALDW